MANLILSNCLPLMPIRFDKRDLVSLNASPCALSTPAQLFGRRGITHGLDDELERNSVRLVRLFFKVKAVDKVSPISVLLFFRHPFRVQSGKLRQHRHRIFWEKLFVHFAPAHFVYPHVLHGLVVQFGLLLQSLVEIAYGAQFGHEGLEGFLQTTSADEE